MSMDQLLALGGIVASILVATYGGVLTYRATRSKTSADKEQGAGVLALELVRELRLELTDVKKELKETKGEVNQIKHVWWPNHEQWDDAVEEILSELEPDKISKLPPRTRMPS